MHTQHEPLSLFSVVATTADVSPSPALATAISSPRLRRMLLRSLLVIGLLAVLAAAFSSELFLPSTLSDSY